MTAQQKVDAQSAQADVHLEIAELVANPSNNQGDLVSNDTMIKNHGCG